MYKSFSAGFFILALAVILGAFGAHLLEPAFTERGKEVFQTASRYHFIHGIGLLILGLFNFTFPAKGWKTAFNLMFLGIVLFSGSLYLLAFKQHMPTPLLSILGPLTPIGGILLIAGWVYGGTTLLRNNFKD